MGPKVCFRAKIEQNYENYCILSANLSLTIIMSPQPKGGGHIGFGADLVGISFGVSVASFLDVPDWCTTKSTIHTPGLNLY